MKVHILGAPGSGKTTLAREVSARFQIPHYELDRVDWEPDAIIAHAEQPAWVADGIYLIWTEPLLYQADYIVLLEVSWPVAVWRMIRRHIWNSLRGTQLYPGMDGFKALSKLVRDARRYILSLDHGDKPARDALLTYLEQQRALVIPPTEESLSAYIATCQQLTLPFTDEFVRLYLARYQAKLVFVRTKIERAHLLEILTKM